MDNQPQHHFVRFNPDGTLDASFYAPVNGFVPVFPPYEPTVNSMAVQPDGKIILGGSFTLVGGTPVTNICRLNGDSSVDDTFNSGARGSIYCVSLQPDGLILVGGIFTNLSGLRCTNLGRLYPDGSLDTSFNPSLTGGVYTVALQTDGKILIGGNFLKLNGQTNKYLGRLNSDGTLDASFNANADGPVNALLLQSDGKILVGGSFTRISGQPQMALARLNNTDPAMQDLSFDSSSITWLRSGTSPEIWRSSFAYSTNGTDWVDLGAGTRISGGWQLSGLSVPLDPQHSALLTVRARGYYTGGRYNGSSSIIETFAGPPIITSQPLSVTNNAATPAAFRVVAGGTPALGYQWRKSGTNLVDGGNISGAYTPLLSLSNVFGADAGAYSIVVTNALGSVTSAVATLTVIDPFITVQPTNQWPNAGQTGQFSVTAVGTVPLSYQWRKHGTNLVGVSAVSLTISNAQRANIGSYDVVVSNSFGTVSSAVARLGVNLATPDSFARQGDVGVESILVQPDGKLVMAGWTNLGIYGVEYAYLIRDNPDGTRDTNFNVAVNGSDPYYVTAVVTQPDGKFLIGGGFSTVNGQVRTNLARVNGDGSLDTSFTLGANDVVDCLAQQPDGKTLAGGYFYAASGGTRWALERFSSDGTLDAFQPVPDTHVHTVAVQPDGKIVVGGEFLHLNYRELHPYIGRVNQDGTIDSSFTLGADSTVLAVAIQADGKILVGGGFTNLGGQARSCIGRLNSDGTLDTSFNPGAGYYVNGFAVQTDGKILVAGLFSSLDGLPANGFGRLNPDGSRDLTFNPGQTGYVDVNCVALQPDGKILVGANGTNSVFRLNNTDPATKSLTVNGSTITWLRGGSSPEVWRTTFEASADGANWMMLGAGTRITGGWQWEGTIPSGSIIRARGWVTGGYFNGSAWFVESTLASRPVMAQDGNFGMRSNQFGFNTRANAGQVVVIEASTNLANWMAIQTNVVTASGIFYFTDPDSARFTRRMYRARLFTGALPQPTMNGTRWNASLPVGFNLNAIPGQTVIIEASTDLKTWTPLSTNDLASPTLSFTDAGPTNYRWRFYRARVQ
jgi:uncharacterized delta-60 repeat protein